MKQFWATFCKDLLVLWRDRAGLLVLFLMPAVLVLVVSLVQNNVLETTGAAGLRVLLVDSDGGALAQKLRDRLDAIEALQLVESIDARPVDEAGARRLVSEGDFQFGIVIPAGASELLEKRAGQLVRAALDGGETTHFSTADEDLPLVIFFDPTVQGIFRTALSSSLHQVLLGIEIEEKGRELASTLNAALDYGNGGYSGKGPLKEDVFSRVLVRETLLPVREQSATAGKAPLLPNAVQQNVPAWALFGMFFIVVPLSGALLRERNEGTLLRLRTLPVSYEVILFGKIVAFVAVCLVQFSLMLAVGKFLLPFLGTPELNFQGRLPAAYVLALCAALAATGFGLLIGAIARSYEQASMLGAVSVVLAAAIGGVMVPVYVMPRAMQTLSAFSPLAWGLDGFLKIFVRGGDLNSVFSNALSLLAFFACNLILALAFFRRTNKFGR